MERIFKLYLVVFFSTNIAGKTINEIINDVTLKDNHYFNDLGPEEYYGIAIFKEGRVNITFKVGQAFRGQVIEEEAELLQDIVESLNKSAVRLRLNWPDGRKCIIGMSAGQLVRNYVRYYRMTKEVSKNRPNFIKILAKRRRSNEKVMITLLQTVSKSVESGFKFLPYQISHFSDLFQFTVSQDLQARYFITFEMTMSDGCLPERPFQQDKILSYGQKVTNKTIIVPQQQLKNFSNNSNGLKIQENNCDPDISIPSEVTSCFNVMDDVEPVLRHLYMMSVQMQHLFFLRYEGKVADDDDTEVCAVTLDPGTASSTKTNFEHTMIECCNVIIDRQKLFRAGEMKQGWQCHDPYFFSRLLLEFLSYFSIILTTLIPMSFTMLPSCIETEKERVITREKEEKGSVYNLRKDTDSLHSENMGRRMKVAYKSNSTTDTLSLDHSETEDEKEDALSRMLDFREKNQDEEDTGPSYDLIFLNEDPVYKFGANDLVWHFFLFHINNHYITVARRLLFFYGLWVFHYLGTLQMYLFYINIYLYKWQSQFPSILTFAIYNPNEAHATERDFQSVLLVYLLVVPLIFAIIQFILLSPLLTNPEPIAKVLYWDEHESALGRYMGVDLRDDAVDFNLPYEDRLVKNLSARLYYLMNKKFWKYMFCFALFKITKDNEDSEDEDDADMEFSLKKSIYKILILPFIWPFYTLPLFTTFRNFFTYQSVEDSSNLGQCKWLKRTMIVVGIISLIFLFLPIAFIYVCMLLFFIVDIFRNLKSTLTQAIFLISILGNVRDAFSSLEDDYRTIKVSLFNILDNFAESGSDEEKKYQKAASWKSETGVVAIPKILFERVCDSYLPYNQKVSEVLGGLVKNFLFTALLYALIVDYQIFDELSETGESVITVIFVSLPSLLSKEKSDSQNELESKERDLKLEVHVLEVFESQDFWRTLIEASGPDSPYTITTV